MHYLSIDVDFGKHLRIRLQCLIFRLCCSKIPFETGHSGPFLIQLLKNRNEIEQTAAVVSVQKELNLLLAFLRIVLKEPSEMSLKH